MSYMGVRVTKFSHIITVNLHGPLVGFPVNPTELRACVETYFQSNVPGSIVNFNMITHSHFLAKTIADIFCDGDKILWIEVIVQSPNDTVYTAVEERLTANV